MKALRHAGIVVSNLEKSLKFYQDLLGLKIVKKMDESGDFIDKISSLEDVKVTTVKMAAKDGNLIELLYYNSHPQDAGIDEPICRVGVSHVAFTVDNIDDEYNRLREAGIRFNSPPQFSPDGYAKVAFCRDPDGALIELVEVLDSQ